MDKVYRWYLWRAGKKKQKVHLLNLTTGKSYCQLENNGVCFTQKSELRPGLPLCMNCDSLAEQDDEPRLSVLMGEAVG